MSSAVALVLSAALAIGGAPEAKLRVYKSTVMKDMEDLAAELRRHVALLDVEVTPAADDPLGDRERQGYAVVLDGHRLAAMSFIVEGAKRITVRGPKERAVEGKVTVRDDKLRVAVIETKAPLEEAGLSPAAVAPLATRQEGGDVFALVFTGSEAGVMHGVFIYVGDDPEYGGHHRIDLKLSRGMPVFDGTARFVGYARTVAWDTDPLMLVTPEMIAAARTSTASAALPGPKDGHPPKPWWSK